MITQQTIDVLDEIDVLGDMILQSDLYQSFKAAKARLNQDEEAHLMYEAFLKSKAQYEDIMRFGKYHPDYRQIMLETRKRKRADERLPVGIDYKQKEVALQELVDEVISKIAYSVSDHVKIEAGNPFFQQDKEGCASGGSCHCSL